MVGYKCLYCGQEFKVFEPVEYMLHLKKCNGRRESMSVKAYRILQLDIAEPASFDVLEDKKLVEFLKDKMQFMVVMDKQGTDIIHVPVELLKEARAKAGMNLETMAFINRDIEFAEERHKEFVEYLIVGS